MTRIVGTICVAAAGLCLMLLAARGEDQQAVAVDEPANAEVLKILDKKIQLEYLDIPLNDVTAELSDVLDVNMRLDRRALADAGIETDVSVTVSLRGISLRSALRLMLRDLGLTYTVRDGMLILTTPESADASLSTEVYPVTDLVVDGRSFDSDSLIRLLTSIVMPESWDELGGPGSVSVYSGSLVVSQTEEAHGQLADLLAALRRLRRQLEEPGEETRTIFVEQHASSIRKALTVKARLEYLDLPLSDVIADLSVAHDIPIVIDRRGLNDAAIGTDIPVNIALRDIPLGVALREMLGELGLTYAVHREVVMITTPEENMVRSVRIYPAHDLVADRGPAASLEDLIEVVTSTVSAYTWQHVGGAAVCESGLPRNPSLVISQSEQVHQQIEALLAQLRQAKQRERQLNPAIEKLPAAGDRLETQVYTLSVGDGLPSAEDVEQVLRKLIPGPWAAPYMLMSIEGRLVVRHKASVHKQVRQLLMQLGTAGLDGVGFGGGGGGFGGGSGGFGGGGGGLGGGGYF